MLKIKTESKGSEKDFIDHFLIFFNDNNNKH